MLGPHGDGTHGFCGNVHGVWGGFPSNSGRQKHVGLPLILRHPELGPHGFGVHSFPSGTGKKELISFGKLMPTQECVHWRTICLNILTAILEWISS